MRSVLLLAGKPGIGKSTVGELATDTIAHARYMSMGDRLRAIGMGKIASRYSDALASNSDTLKQHAPVPPEVAIGVFEEFLEASDGPALVDGYPRYPNRLPSFKESIARTNSRVVAICLIDAPDSIALQRMSQRAQRYADITEDIAFQNKRLKDYYDYTKPTIDALSQDIPLHVLDGLAKPAVLAAQVADIFEASQQTS